MIKWSLRKRFRLPSKIIYDIVEDSGGRLFEIRFYGHNSVARLLHKESKYMW